MTSKKYVRYVNEYSKERFGNLYESEQEAQKHCMGLTPTHRIEFEIKEKKTVELWVNFHRLTNSEIATVVHEKEENAISNAKRLGWRFLHTQKITFEVDIEKGEENSVYGNCPKCNGNNISMEKSPDGKTICRDCHFSLVHSDWKKSNFRGR